MEGEGHGDRSRFVRRLVGSTFAGFSLFFALELSARVFRFPKKALAQALLAPLLPLVPILGSWIDVDSKGLAGTLFRSVLFSAWVLWLALLFDRSRKPGTTVWRALLGVCVVWSLLAIVVLQVFRVLVEASFGSR